MEVPYYFTHGSQVQYPEYLGETTPDRDNWYQSQPFLGWSPEMVSIQSPMNYYPYSSGTEFQAPSYQFQSQYSYAHIPVFSGVDTSTLYAPPATEHHDLYLNVEPYNPFMTSAVNQCEVVSPNSESIIPVPQVFDESFDRGMQASQSIKEEFQMSEEFREEILKRLAEMREILSGSVLNQKDKGEGSDPSIQSEVKLFDESPKPVLLHKEDSSEVLSSEESEASVEVNEEAAVVIKGEITDVKVFEERPQPVLASVDGFSEIIHFNGIVANSAHELSNENIADTRKVLNRVVNIEPKPPNSINAGVTLTELHPEFTMQFTVQNLQSDVISKEAREGDKEPNNEEKGTSEADVCNLNDFFYKKQTSTVDKFYDDLMSLLPMVETYCEELPEGVIVDVFVSGLAQEIREYVEAYCPSSISYALEMAVFHEKRILEVSENRRSHGDHVETGFIKEENNQNISIGGNLFVTKNDNTWRVDKLTQEGDLVITNSELFSLKPLFLMYQTRSGVTQVGYVLWEGVQRMQFLGTFILVKT